MCFGWKLVDGSTKQADQGSSRGPGVPADTCPRWAEVEVVVALGSGDDPDAAAVRVSGSPDLRPLPTQSDFVELGVTADALAEEPVSVTGQAALGLPLLLVERGALTAPPEPGEAPGSGAVPPLPPAGGAGSSSWMLWGPSAGWAPSRWWRWCSASARGPGRGPHRTPRHRRLRGRRPVRLRRGRRGRHRPDRRGRHRPDRPARSPDRPHLPVGRRSHRRGRPVLAVDPRTRHEKDTTLLQQLLAGLLAAVAYGVVGVAMMALGYVLVDLATPGRLRDLIWVQRNPNAALLLVSGLLGVGIILTTAIAASSDDLVAGLVGTLAYGILGLILMSLSFLLVDAITPGKLGEELATPDLHPATWVSAGAHLVIAVIIAAAIW